MTQAASATVPVTAQPSSFARNWPFLALLALSALLHFAWYQRPLTVVLDEVYYPRFALDYLKHEYFFDLHPPLGKLIYFVTAWFAGLDPGFSFASNQLAFPDSSYLALRVPPRLAGTLLPLVLAGVALELGLSRTAALVIGALATLDNALLVISRFALIDAFVLLFGFGALWCYLHGRDRGWWWLIGTALLAGAAVSVKWTGLAFVGLVLIDEGARWLRAPKAAGFVRMAAIVLLGLTVYVACFAAHFALASRTGRDDGVMSQEFQSTLAGNPNAADRSLKRPGFLARFAELHYRMFDGTRKSIAPHPYASRWFEWPFMTRSLDFWAEHADGKIAHIYVLGNPVVWWASTYCMLLLLVNFPPRLVNATLSQPRQPLERIEVAVAVAYLANMLPFMPIARVLFAYHYLPALCVALIGLGYLLDRSGGYRKSLAIAVVALAVVGFVYIAPLTYGLPLEPGAFDARFLVPGWR